MSASLKPDPTAIGQVSAPPFAVLPDPKTLFLKRAARLANYASVSPLRPYLEFVGGVVGAQHALAQAAPRAAPPDEATLARAASFSMPPLDRRAVALDDRLDAMLDQMFDAVAHVPKPDAAAEALISARSASRERRAAMINSVLDHSIPAEEFAEHVYVAAMLQVHFAHLASALDAERLKAVGDGVCPACGGPPVASLIVEWPSAHGNRFCACSLCSTLWNYVRIRCCSCGSTKGIGYQEIDQSPGTIKAETCDECRTYVKVMYQNKDGAIEPVADDIGSLALDMMMREGPYRRAAFNPFLIGY
ncbi:MAG: formate dehydrogenase accessory protein FdhE [Rhizobiales bacterium]|nr:formate dehydrogenase accessory protein FdhE [Hyphomicrobiales bacterium]